MLLKSREQKPELQLNILQCIEQPLKQRIIQLRCLQCILVIPLTPWKPSSVFHLISYLKNFILSSIASRVLHNLSLVLLFRTSPTLPFNTQSVPAKPGDSAQPSPNTARAPLRTTLFRILTGMPFSLSFLFFNLEGHSFYPSSHVISSGKSSLLFLLLLKMGVISLLPGLP